MVCDAESVNNRIARRLLEPTITDCASTIARWLQRRSVSKSANSTTSHSERSDSATRNCKKRDNHMCILTKDTDPDAAHIYPNSLLNASTREPDAVERFWDMLNVFWDESRVQRWKSGIFGNENTPEKPHHGCFNLLSLDQKVHKLWGDAKFALRPIEQIDSRTLKVEFHWQRGLSNPVAKVDLLKKPESSRGVCEYFDRRFGHRRYSIPLPTGTYKDNGEPEYRPITSGDVFTITTSNPTTMPLPSWALLEMQWHLQRVAGMSGAAEVENIPDYDDDNRDTTAIRDDPVELTRRINEWLGIFSHDDESFEVQQPPIEVRHATMDS
ncbi:hypothetical protein RU639_013342 [Aspergillus parasiticus]